MSPVGLARFSTLRSWLSQWSYDDARADGPKSLSRISAPVLVINNSADDACTPSHGRRLFDAVRYDDKRFYEVKGATHYYQDQPALAAEAVGVIKRWLADHGFAV
jgi:pimeloyl-ACP methyl ester carboxylesterase